MPSGRIVAWAFDNWNSGSSGIQTPYDIALKPTVFHAAKTPLRQGSYRALAATANHYAREMHMDDMARALGVDAVAFRLHAPEGRAHARTCSTPSRRTIGWPKPSAAGRSPGHRVRHREGGLCRDGGRSVLDARARRRLQGRAHRHRLRVRRHRESRRAARTRSKARSSRASAARCSRRSSSPTDTCATARWSSTGFRGSRTPRSIETILLDRRDIPSAGAGESTMICRRPGDRLGGARIRQGRYGAADPALARHGPCRAPSLSACERAEGALEAGPKCDETVKRAPWHGSKPIGPARRLRRIESAQRTRVRDAIPIPLRVPAPRLPSG